MSFAPDFWNVRDAFCSLCGDRRPVVNGVADFSEPGLFPGQGRRPVEKIMNSALFARIYETPFWRPLHTRVGTGLSWDEEIRRVVEMAGLKSPKGIADLACGTGRYARVFRREFPEASVYALDLSQNMLRRGRRLAERYGMTSIAFLRGDIRRLPFGQESLDFVNCGGSLHLFPQQDFFWREVFRILKPGGIFTAMTIPLVGGWIGLLQRKIMDKKKGAFFVPGDLSERLSLSGFVGFRHFQRRLLLVFKCRKKT
jgi:SAM-dependent methyltransferase